MIPKDKNNRYISQYKSFLMNNNISIQMNLKIHEAYISKLVNYIEFGKLNRKIIYVWFSKSITAQKC